MRLEVTAGDRLDRFLSRQLPDYSRSRLAEWIEAGRVTVDGRVRKPSFRLEPGMAVELDAPEARPAHDLTPADVPVPVAYEDDWLLVVNKPRGMAVHPAASLKEPSLVNALLGRGGALSEGSEAWRPGIVHRLDKETTGLLVVAKTDQAHRRLAEQIEAKTATREYLAVVAGHPREARMRIEAPIGRDPRNPVRMAVASDGKPAVTHVETVRRLDRGTLVRCRLETGRTHQIRVHLLAIGHPVLGDKVYAPREYRDVPLQLHAWRLGFTHPGSGETVAFEVEPPEDFLAQEAG